MVLRFLFHVGRAVACQGIGDIARAAADPSLLSAGDLIGKIAADAWSGLRAEKQRDKLHADILAAAKLEFAEARRQAVEIARQVAPDDPDLQGHVERFVTLVPAAIQASLRRADDPTGTTLPAGFALEDESDIVKMLPVRFPREHFKPGYAPPFLRGWELVTQLGAGGFGEVWQVRNIRANQLVGAVKFGHALNDAELSLLNENDVLNRLLAAGKHPGIVELQDVWADGDAVPWLRYEYISGGDLTGLMRRWAVLPMEQRLPKVLAAFRELCETVGYFHRLTPAIVHRDLKPSNILVTADGKLKVSDFGIGSVSAKRVLDGERLGTLSRTNTVQAYLRGAHTPLYAPPEQKTDPKHRPAPTDDVHALGVILYQMLTGRLDAAPGPKFERDLTGAPKELIELIGDCVDRKEKRPTDAEAVLASVPTSLAVPRPKRSGRLPGYQAFMAQCQENMDLWFSSGEPERWVGERLSGWDNSAVNTLLTELEKSDHFQPMDGTLARVRLETLRVNLLAEREKIQREAKETERPALPARIQKTQLVADSRLRNRFLQMVWAVVGLVAGILFALALREYGWKPVVYFLAIALAGCGIGFVIGALIHVGNWLDLGQGSDVHGGWRETWHSAVAGAGVFGVLAAFAGLIIFTQPRVDTGGLFLPLYWDIVLYPLTGMVIFSLVGWFRSAQGSNRRAR